MTLALNAFHAPPFTAIYAERGEGWVVTDHLLAQAVDALNRLVWFKTADGQSKNPRHTPERVPRPGMAKKDPKAGEKSMTVEEYAAKAGIRVNFDPEEG
jgi:hypothetical protein